jgi:hypothetical protein
MPEYLYQHPTAKKIISIHQSIHETHEYFDEKGIKWERIFTIPQLNTEGSLDVNCTQKEFSEYTKKKKGGIGDLWDRSAELSEKRKAIYGEDPVKQKYLSEWKKKRKNKNHPHAKK